MTDTLVWRLLADDVKQCGMHFAVEESIMRMVGEGAIPGTLRLRRAEPSVWLGVFQRAGEDVDIAECRRLGVPVVRRYNPGGAVYQDSGTFCYSVFCRRESLTSHFGPDYATDLFRLSASAVIRTISDFGLNAEETGVNDVCIGGRKVYGSAQVEYGHCVVHSGTFLVSADIDRMERLLKPSLTKLSDKPFRSVGERVVNLSDATGRRIAVEAVMRSLSANIADAMNVRLRPGCLSEEEHRLAQEIHEIKYGLDEWNHPVLPEFQTSVARKISGGVVVLSVNWRDGVVRQAAVNGDFQFNHPEALEALSNSLKGCPLPRAVDSVRASSLAPELRKAIADLLAESYPLG